MQVIGLCRFSYPAEGGFQVEHAGRAAREAYLYAPARMAERLRHFEAIALPGLRAQTDGDFTLLVLIGDSLPARWRTRLEALLADLPQARIVARPPGPHRKVTQETINAHRDMRRPCLEFRHDDDDAVAVDFVARLRGAAAECAGLLARHRLVAMDFNRGFVVRPDARGLWAEPSFRPYLGVALAMAVQAGVRQSIMNFAHARVSRFMPTLTFTDEPMYLRGHNDHNDSRQGANVQPPNLSLLDAEGEAMMRRRFAVDCGRVRRVFG